MTRATEAAAPFLINGDGSENNTLQRPVKYKKGLRFILETRPRLQSVDTV